MVHDAALVEDLLQQTFMRAHQARDRFASVGDAADRAVEGWYLSIARNVALDHLREHYRRERRHATMVARQDAAALGVREYEPNAEELRVKLEQDEQTASAVRAALEQLPATQRDVVTLHKLQGLSMADVADRLHVQQGAVRVRAHRAYKALSHLLEGQHHAAA
jgi:RNA polymerase sigma-70 factor (ECF subfamily)